ncbi:pyoverdine biosynthesis protein PvcB [Legionella birminghamensis]|uniref:Pyoverdine biosynthesis protein PvcB n=1 Tax=Legionella birminghamensis TaxID=28083 RepID=A0A378ID48_9GAMM|nr:TauD/TfdA family dioxygenase [Legionella birminghamensis]KTC75361.1 pyoverdine biosynthesis protein PvcB [Legionella birminghamensis]STX33129.1 pyoverdine biosynthesis protein PvcB [Legionella birminghamensis]
MNCKMTRLKPFGILLEPIHKNFRVEDLDVSHLRELFQGEQLVLLRGFSAFKSAADFAGYCESWGEISVWPFGKVLELIEQDNPADHIFDHSYVPMHWDGMYRPQVPEYQMFHCVKAPLAGQGGRTTFSNTILALKNTPSKTKNLWEKVTGLYQRKMEFYNSKTISPIISKHPYKDYSVIRYNEPPSAGRGRFVNPPQLEFSGLESKELVEFHRSMRKALYAPDHFYAHAWQTGDVVIADNFSLLHGREAFISQSPRHLQRVHVLSNPPFTNPGLEFHQ